MVEEKEQLCSSASQLQNPQRLRFFVELKDHETTVVSWKKLLRDHAHKQDHDNVSGSSKIPELPAGANPALQARIAPEPYAGHAQVQNDVLPTPANRFSAVIERIERLYQGHSTDDEFEDAPDDDQYDTEDSFIDDQELDDYFSVDSLRTKHTGYFINRGKLEQVEHTPSPESLSKKRKRDLKKTSNLKINDDVPEKLQKSGNLRLKAAARNAPLTGSHLVGSGESDPSSMVNGTSTVSLKKSKEYRSLEKSKKEEKILALKASLKNSSTHNVEAEVALLKESASTVSRNTFDKGAKSSGTDDAIYGLLDKDISLSADNKIVKYRKGSVEQLSSDKLRIVERSGRSSPRTDLSRLRKKPLPLKPDNPDAEVKVIKRRKRRISSTLKDDSNRKHKAGLLETAIQELKNSIAEWRPCHLESQDLEQGPPMVKKRLPHPIKLQLANIGRLAVCHGKIPKELIQQLMTIVGHLVQVRTLKKNLFRMLETGKPDHEQKLLYLKEELTIMVKPQILSLKSKLAEQHQCSSDDFQGHRESSGKSASIRKFKFDKATEDKMCDLCDQYLECIKECKSSHINRLYMEIADIWPEGWMDHNSIKIAIDRARLRRRRKCAKDSENKRELDAAHGVTSISGITQPCSVTSKPASEGERNLGKKTILGETKDSERNVDYKN